jgi:ribosomal protein S18 acetylase RimI-like enzyme
MQAAIRIRGAEEDDALELSKLAERTFRAAFAESNSAADMQKHCASHYGEPFQLAEIREPGRETWVAEDGARLVAYVQLRLDAVSPVIPGGRPVEIQRFYVDASHHGTGLAHQLMSHVLARAEAVGSTVVWLGVWERNQRALAFYRKWQFDVVGEHTFEVGDDPQRDLGAGPWCVAPSGPWPSADMRPRVLKTCTARKVRYTPPSNFEVGVRGRRRQLSKEFVPAIMAGRPKGPGVSSIQTAGLLQRSGAFVASAE